MITKGVIPGTIQKKAFGHFFVIVALLSALSVACSKKNAESDSPPGQGPAFIQDKERYAAVPSMIISYVNYPIFDIRLLLSADEKTAFRDAIILPSVFPNADTNNWGGIRVSDGGPGTIAWGRTWPVAGKYKIWWQRIVDPVAYASAKNYNPYTTRTSKPGAAWCEAFVTLNKPLPALPGHFVLHFYPDGRVEADVSEKKLDRSQDPPYRLIDRAEEPRHTEQERHDLKTLDGAPCLKEIPNPYFGTARPVQMN